MLMLAELWLISKFMTSQAGQQMIPIHMITNVSRSEGNQAMKFGQFTKYSEKNLYFQKSCRK